MRVVRVQPGRKGTKKLLARYGHRLVCVRYRYDERENKRFKTVELLLEETAWDPRRKRLSEDSMVGVQVGWREVDLRNRIKRAGARWDPSSKLWEMKYGQVVEMGLQSRIDGSGGLSPHKP